jgi:hypothetical protein
MHLYFQINKKKMKFKIVLFILGFVAVYLILYNNKNLSIKHRSLESVHEISMIHVNQDKIVLRFLCHLKPILNITDYLKVLVLSKKSNTIISKELIILFELNRIDYRILTLNSKKTNTIRLNTNRTILFNLIIFESADLFYESIDFSNKLKLADFCKLFNVGLILFTNSLNQNFTQLNFITNDESIKLNHLDNLKPKSCHLNCLANTFRLTKCDKNEKDFTSIQNKSKSLTNSIDFSSNDYESLFQCDFTHHLIIKTKYNSKLRFILISNDLIELVEIYSLILFDLISYASNNRFKIETSRHIQIDIDDIFVGSTGKRMKPKDVDELINFQEKYLNQLIFNKSFHRFKFNLGYSGYYYQSGDHLENEADYFLIQKKGYFNWFDHGWSHYQPHILNSTSLLEQMYYNYNFASNHDLPIDSFYAVSPHHSGIYPIYDQFFKHWSEFWLIKATSTEEFPHLRPYWLRRGFIHNGIMVLPRQTCGIYTHTIHIDSYPNGIDNLISMVRGGEIFKTIIYNRVLFYMTHMTNYGNDRLALFLFRNIFDYLMKWTNLEFKSMPPLDLAKKYFDIYPQGKFYVP